jgi:hypothetical protein
MSKRNLFFGLCAVLLSASLSQAAVSVNVQSEIIVGSSTTVTTGFADVFLGISGTGNGTLQTFDAGVNLDTSAGQPTGLSFGTPTLTDVGTPPRTPVLGDSGFGVAESTASRILIDQSVSQASAVNLDGANNEGLVRIPFTIAAGTVGVFHVNLDTDENTGTILVTPNSDVIPYTANNGTITVTLPLPEPASISLLALGFGGLLIRRRKAAC